MALVEALKVVVVGCAVHIVVEVVGYRHFGIVVAEVVEAHSSCHHILEAFVAHT